MKKGLHNQIADPTRIYLIARALYLEGLTKDEIIEKFKTEGLPLIPAVRDAIEDAITQGMAIEQISKGSGY